MIFYVKFGYCLDMFVMLYYDMVVEEGFYSEE